MKSNKTLELSNGKFMPQLGLGTWKATEPDSLYRAVRHAIEIGIHHIDCAAIYMNEKEVGRAIQDALKTGDVQREELWITSKLWNDSQAASDVQPALDRTLSNLGLEYLDLYLIHWPVALKKGANFPLEPGDFVAREEQPLTETWAAMEEQVRKGKVGSIGVSNFGPKNLQHILDQCEIAPVMNQVEMHAYWPQDELRSFCESKNIAITAYSPLGSYDRSEEMKAANEPVLLKDPNIAEIANTKDDSIAQILISWLIHKGVAVIPKSVTPSRIEENYRAQFIRLTPSEIAKINAIGTTYQYVDGSFWAPEGGPYLLEDVWK